MDLTTIIGIILGFLLVSWGILLGSSLMLFVDLPSACIVFGGTLASTLIAFPLRELKTLIPVTRNAFFHRVQKIPDIIKVILRFALKARREGILALESEIETVKDPFIIKSLQLAVDGTSPEVIEEVLRNEVSHITERHAVGQSIFKALGYYGPCFGMIGTLIGLVQMLKNMNDPSAIGPGMAVALITTFYGAMLANLIALPIAAKLKLRSDQEVLVKEVIISGILAIQSGDNPRVIEQKLQVFIAPKSRKNALDEITHGERKA